MGPGEIRLNGRTRQGFPGGDRTEEMTAERVLVCRAGGFIGSHMVKRLKREGFWVRGVELKQTRFFLYIDECLEGTCRLMRSDYTGPVNIGSEEMVSIDALAGIVTKMAGKRLSIRHIQGPTGVRG